MMDEQTVQFAEFFYGARIFLILWIIINAIATMRRNRSLNEVFSSQTLYGIYNSFLILLF